MKEQLRDKEKWAKLEETMPQIQRIIYGLIVYKLTRSVRLFNRTPGELQLAPSGEEQWADFKLGLKLYCMEQELGSSLDWPSYDYDWPNKLL